jgi:hypothetical protein
MVTTGGEDQSSGSSGEPNLQHHILASSGVRISISLP